jgi:hypothetical protein
MKTPQQIVRTGGALELDPASDFVRTDRGVTWGVKVTDTPDISFVMIFVRGQDGQWTSDGSAEARIDGDFRASVGRLGGIGAWMAQVCVPGINAWLAAKFPAGIGAQSTAAEQADAAIRALRVLMRPDGTLYVE